MRYAAIALTALTLTLFAPAAAFADDAVATPEPRAVALEATPTDQPLTAMTPEPRTIEEDPNGLDPTLIAEAITDETAVATSLDTEAPVGAAATQAQITDKSTEVIEIAEATNVALVAAVGAGVLAAATGAGILIYRRRK